MHGSFTHIAFNMFAVWMFGSQLENLWGSKRFLNYYLLTGLGAAFLHFIIIHWQIKILENTTGQKVVPLKTNAYINDSIKNTRMYHIDNAQPVIYKAFIYLSNVPDLSYGPYSFVKKTHSLSLYPYINLFKNLFVKKHASTDMSFYNKKMVFSGIGKKGDLILSSQNGIHRGLPQKEGRQRVVLVLSFMIKSKLTYLHKSAKKDLVKTKTNQQEQKP